MSEINRKRGRGRRKKPLILRMLPLLLALLVLAVAAAAVLGVMWKKGFFTKSQNIVAEITGNMSSTPEEQFAAYVELLNQQDYNGMYNMLTRECRRAMTREAFVNRNQSIYEKINAQNFTVTFPENPSKGGTVSYTMELDFPGGEIVYDNTVDFVADETVWKLDWKDSVIFPDLEENGSVSVSRMPATRGCIYDRNGVLLAGNGDAASVGLVPGKMEGDSVKKLAEALESTEASIRKLLSAAWVTDDSFVPVRTILRESELVLTWPREDGTTAYATEKALLEIPGVMIQATTMRVYPLGAAAAHLVGYVQGISAEQLKADESGAYSVNSLVGKTGLEALYEEKLRGTVSQRISILSPEGEVVKVLAMANPAVGEDVQVTIDARLQQLVYDTYQEDCSATAAMNPYTGEVMALVSTPSYDPNLMVYGISQTLWDSWNEDPRKPLTNRFRASFVPGSSMKPITALIGVSADLLNSKKNLKSSRSWQQSASWGDYRVTTVHVASPATMTNALIVSDNVYFAKAALQIGASAMEEGWKSAGFGEELPFPIIMTASSYANEGQVMTDILLADSGYGQGQMLVNPLHMAVMYSALLNEGSMIAPQLLPGETGRFWKQNVFTEAACIKVNAALKLVVTSKFGTAKAGYMRSVAIAGKTGTAELKATQEDETGTELGWFTSYTTRKSEADSLLMSTVVEDVKDRDGSEYVVLGSKEIYQSWYSLED